MTTISQHGIVAVVNPFDATKRDILITGLTPQTNYNISIVARDTSNNLTSTAVNAGPFSTNAPSFTVNTVTASAGSTFMVSGTWV